jgi:hypothetical protein
VNHCSGEYAAHTFNIILNFFLKLIRNNKTLRSLEYINLTGQNHSIILKCYLWLSV